MTVTEAEEALDLKIAEFKAEPTAERRRYVENAMQYYADAWIAEHAE